MTTCSVPVIAWGSSSGPATVQWVVTGYLLALAVMIPVTGWAVDRW
jgi:MFS family permease